MRPKGVLDNVRMRSLMALVALAAVCSAGLFAFTTLSARASATRHSADNAGKERFDIVGEGHQIAGLEARFGHGAFPGRNVTVTIPPSTAVAAADIRVLEDGFPVDSLVATHVGQAPTSRYSLRWVSRRASGEREVEVSIVVGSVGAIDVDYNAPFATASKSTSFWTSGYGMVAMAFTAAGLVVLALIFLIVPRRRRTALRRRVGEFTGQFEQPETELAAEHPVHRFDWLERLLGRMRWWPKFKNDVENAGLTQSPVEIVAVCVICTVAAAAVIGVAVGTVVVSILVLPIGAGAAHSVVQHKLRKRRQAFADQLASHLEELASAMRAGHGLVAGLSAVTRTSSEPSRAEWTRVLADEQLGMSLDEAMQMLAARMDCDDVEQAALVASLHHRTGGNMAEVLDRVSEGVRERAELRREFRTLTSQARLSRWIVTALPVGLVALISLIDPSYTQPLFHTTGGIIVMVIAVGFVTAGSFVMRKMTDIKV